MRCVPLSSALFLALLGACRADPKPEESMDGLPAVDTGISAEVDGDGDGVPAADDCDDGDASVFPGADEVCNERDDDCDGVVDNGVQATFYVDLDGDGAGDPERGELVCTAPAGTVADGSDCDDTDATVFPGADERCDGRDNDCDATVDEDVRTSWYGDTDDDGFGDPDDGLEDCDPPLGYVADDSDCDDTNAAVFPGADEWCDGLDNDCNDVVDEEALDARVFYADTDADGYGNVGVVAEACAAPSGFVADATDCDDTRAAAFPGAEETCNSLDDDCDGDVDESAVDAPTWYVDVDGDGYGSSAFSTAACTEPTGFQATATDCNDGDATISPAATERCDAVDNDCDGTVDEDDAVDAQTWFADADADGFGDPSVDTTACSEPAGYGTDATDCDDTDATVFPGSTATETPFDGIDQDCDGLDRCTDLDCDGQVDLFIGNHYSGSSYAASQQVFLNTGAGPDTMADTSVSGTGTWSTQVDDLDDDGYQDLVVVNYRSDSSYYVDSYVYWGSMSGYSDANRDDLQTYGAILSDVGDFDGDGVKDIAFANHYPGAHVGSSYVYYGGTLGFSTGSMDTVTTAGAYGVVAEDFDQDGYDDLVYCNYYDGSAFSLDSYVVYGSATGLQTTTPTALPTTGCRDVVVDDLDGDGWSDIVFANYYSASTGYLADSFVYYGAATGFSATNREELPTEGTLGVSTGDFDGDGRTDLLFGGYYDGSSHYASSYVYYGTATGYTAADSDALFAVGVQQPTAADLNSDGYDDLVLPTYYTGATYWANSYVYYGSSTGIDSAYTSLDSVGTGRVAAGDLDGDGHPELVFSNYYTGTWSTIAGSYVYWGSAGAYTESDRTILDTEGTWAEVVLAGSAGW